MVLPAESEAISEVKDLVARSCSLKQGTCPNCVVPFEIGVDMPETKFISRPRCNTGGHERVSAQRLMGLAHNVQMTERILCVSMYTSRD